MHRSLLSAAVALALAAFPVLHAEAAQARAAVQETTTQLPRGVIPSHYAISLTPDAAASRFSAHAAITVNVTKPASSITLNAADLKFDKVSLAPAAGGPAQDARVSVDAAAQTATFGFDQPVKPGLYKLEIGYTGVIGTQAAARPLHPVRELGRAPHDPVVGRASLQGHLLARRDRARRPDGGQ